MNKENYNQLFIDSFLELIQNEQGEWPITLSSQLFQVNSMGRPYTKSNQLYLAMVARNKGFEDPRWYTFNQMKKQNGKLKPGSKGYAVTCVSYYSRKEGKNYSYPEFLKLSKKNIDEKDIVIRPTFKTVFNKSCIEGIEDEINPKKKILKDIKLFLKSNKVKLIYDDDYIVADYDKSKNIMTCPKLYCDSTARYNYEMLRTYLSETLEADADTEIAEVKKHLSIDIALAYLINHICLEFTKEDKDVIAKRISSYKSLLDKYPTIAKQAVKEGLDLYENIKK